MICNFHISSIIGLRLCRSRILKKSDIDFAKDKYNKYFFNFIVEEFDKYIERLSNKLEKMDSSLFLKQVSENLIRLEETLIQKKQKKTQRFAHKKNI